MTGSAPLRAGVVGLGVGRGHMRAYSELDGVELVALAGQEPDQLAELGADFGVRRLYPDWATMITEGDLDVISVATPTALHAPIAIAALDAGIHVLSEKPMAESLTSARSMADAARANDRVLDISFNQRQRGPVRAMRELITSGLLGDLYYAKAGWLRRQGIPSLGSWFTRSTLAGGGTMMDIGVHMLDMALHLLDEPTVTSASAAGYAVFGPRGRGGMAGRARPVADPDGRVAFEVEDLSTAFLRLSGGATLLLEASWAQWIPHDQCYVTVYGTEGGASYEWGGPPNAPYQRLNVWTEVDGTPAVLQPLVPENGGIRATVGHFLDKVRSGAAGDHWGEEALRRAEVVEAIYASAAKGAEVSLG